MVERNHSASQFVDTKDADYSYFGAQSCFRNEDLLP
jgi:hypothetical protein